MSESVLQQDLNEEAKHSGVYIMWLLFQEQAAMPSAALLEEKLRARFGGVDVVAQDKGVCSFALQKYPVTYEDGKQVPAQLLLTECAPVSRPLGNPIARTQFWNVPNGVALLDSCRWQVMASDFLARGLAPHMRAEVLSGWLDIVLELFPDCVAVFAEPSAKLLTAEQAKNNPYEGSSRFIHFGLNTRFFNVQGTPDSVVDTLGLYALGLPDVQCHFHTLNPNDVVNHVHNVALYQFENDAPIKSGDTVGGITAGEQWKCQYENALIQPVREVLDMAAGDYAAGKRE